MDRDFLIDLFSTFGPVTIRRMFSGYGISADGTNFALALRAGLYFRADETTIPQFEAEGSKPFQYQTRAKTVTVNSYWQLPARLFDDPDELSHWAKAAQGKGPCRAENEKARNQDHRPWCNGGAEEGGAGQKKDESAEQAKASGDLTARLFDIFRIDLRDHAVAARPLGGVEAGVGAFDQRIGIVVGPQQ
jgi:DNA transformation protein and related proteins